MRNIFLLYFLVFYFYSCTHKNTSPVIVNSIDTAATPTSDSLPVSFFPVTSFLKGQVHSIDSMPVTPLRVTIINNKTDSTWLKKEGLKPLLQPFLSPQISKTNLIGFFKQTKFNDQTLNSITFTYDPVKILPDSISLRHWTVYVDPENSNVTKVYIVKQEKIRSETYTYQLIWKTNQSAKITTILNKPDGNDVVIKEEQFIWDF